MHVSYSYRPNLSDHCRRIYLSEQQYGRLVECIKDSFLLGPDGQIVPIQIRQANAFTLFGELG